MTKRELFVRAAMMFEGCVVLMGELDCSDLVARAGYSIGLPDRRSTHKAQTYADVNTATALVDATNNPLQGELLFYGADWQHVTHVAIAGGSGKVISADGATSVISTLAAAALLDSNRVRIHPKNNWRIDFLGARHHSELDE